MQGKAGQDQGGKVRWSSQPQLSPPRTVAVVLRLLQVERFCGIPVVKIGRLFLRFPNCECEKVRRRNPKPDVNKDEIN